MARTNAKVSVKETKKSDKKKKASEAAKKNAAPVPQVLRLIKNDPALAEYADAINGRHEQAVRKMAELTGGTNNLNEFASGYLYFGLHKTEDGWVLREWAPNAIDIFVVGDFNGWKESSRYAMKRVKGSNGNWEIKIKNKSFKHGSLYKLIVHWEGGQGERIPAWATRVVQDPETHIFSAQVWNPEEAYEWQVENHGSAANGKPKFKPTTNPLLIYECHIGMAQDKEGVGTYAEFRDNILPRIAADGYNCIQIMAIQEHPYYGSFGYHVSSFFAPSSRFGTPDDLKSLVDKAHSMGIAVIMDIVHSHAVKNEVEGLGNFAGDPYQYFHSGGRREHPAWDSLCFDYGKNEVLHFLLSNCKYWLEEFRFDGFRFDGVTSMLYYSHGLGESFMSYADYYNGHQDGDAITYLTLANELIHTVNKNAITIAEEVSGMPGLALSMKDGGYGFNYRLAMNIPDYWIKIIKELRDEDWKPSSILWELTNRRRDEKTISYCESHDQALVGDKTIIFRLIDSDMYWHFKKGDENFTVNRGIALHKMIRLVTLGTINGGYLNFMGNEFGHPEWIDFPREGNGWSYKYARRQWNLVDNKELCFHYLGDFDQAMLKTLKKHRSFEKQNVVEIWHNDGDQVFAFRRGDLYFFFNFSPSNSYTGYGFPVEQGAYEYILNTDNPDFGGNGFNDDKMIHYTVFDQRLARDNKGWLQLYLPTRTACVLKKIKE